MDNTTLNYYNANAQDFVQGTVYVDFHITQDRFLAQLEEGASILDFGCGSGRGFFVEREGYPIALAESLASVVQNPAFVDELKDIIEYRTMEYYRSRYEGKE